MSGRVPRLLLAAVAVSMVATACGSGAGGSSVKQGGLFRLGSASSIDSLNPFVAFQQDAYSTFEQIYPMLVQYNPKLQFVPDFARSWQESPDGRTWTFHTQPNAKWSDGKPLTAADAAWTFSTILKFQNGPTANSAGTTAHMASATAPNATTLVVTYKQPVANVLSQLQQVPILPEHIWAKYATGNGKALTTFANPAPIVSGGPFMLVKYTPKQIVLFAQPQLLRSQAAHRRARPAVLRHLRRRDHRAQERPARRDRNGAADVGGHGQVRRVRRAPSSRQLLRR